MPGCGSAPGACCAWSRAAAPANAAVTISGSFIPLIVSGDAPQFHAPVLGPVRVAVVRGGRLGVAVALRLQARGVDRGRDDLVDEHEHLAHPAPSTSTRAPEHPSTQHPSTRALNT